MLSIKAIEELEREDSKIEEQYEALYSDLGKKFEVYLDPEHWVIKTALKKISDNRSRQHEIRKRKNDINLKIARIVSESY
jgi:hypothetical protein